MRLTDILQPDCIKVHLQSTDKQAAIFELADLLCQNTPIEDPGDLKQAIWQRETTRTTGIGHGIGIPHGKCEGVDKLRMAIGIATPESGGIEFGAIDRKPVDLLILLASPIDQTGPHIQALAKISRMLTDTVIRTQLKQSADAQTLYSIILQHEKVTV